MACPNCGGHSAEARGDGTYQCTSRRLVNAVPPGQGGNYGLTAIPIYDVCGAVFTAAASERVRETQVAEADAQAQRARRRATDDERIRARREAEDRAAIEQLPETRALIAALGKALIRDRPAGARPVLREVWVPSRIPFKLDKRAWAELDKAWPVDSFPFAHRAKHGEELIIDEPVGVTAAGRVVKLWGSGPGLAYRNRPSAGIPMEKRFRLTHAEEGDTTEGLFPADPRRLGAVLERLEKDCAAPAADAHEAETPSVAKPLSAGSIRKIEQLRRKVWKASMEISRLEKAWGRPTATMYGETGDRAQVRARRKAWTELERLERQKAQLLAEIQGRQGY